MGTLTGPVRLFVTDEAGNSAAVDLNPVLDQIHLLSLGDSASPPTNNSAPLVAHADGSLVSNMKPANPGEELVAYAVGLGLTSPLVGTGKPTPSPAPRATAPFAINYAFSPNAAPSAGLVSVSWFSTPGDLAAFPAPLFVGLSPGSVGLYHLNSVVPSPPSGTLPCGGNVYSNLTVSFVGPGSLHGASICVTVP